MFAALKSQMATLSDLSGLLPLTIPAELWSTIAPEQQERCLNAQRVLAAFAGDRDLDLSDLAERLEAEPEDVLGGLHVLDAMALVTTEESDDGPRFHLRAVPDEHVRFVGPNGRAQWLFVARPLDPPEIDSDSLN
jgi:hypothetical protein